jgi:hypothetical protein
MHAQAVCSIYGHGYGKVGFIFLYDSIVFVSKIQTEIDKPTSNNVDVPG